MDDFIPARHLPSCKLPSKHKGQCKPEMLDEMRYQERLIEAFKAVPLYTQEPDFGPERDDGEPMPTMDVCVGCGFPSKGDHDGDETCPVARVEALIRAGEAMGSIVASDDDRCGIGVHSFNSEDAEICECGAMKADGTRRWCEDLHHENRCPPDCRLAWRVRNEMQENGST